jgi:hypothetical protein
MTTARRAARGLAVAVALAGAAGAAPAGASPVLSLDDPLLEELLRLRALGRIPFDGGESPVTEARAQTLLVAADLAAERRLVSDDGGPWFRPLGRVALRLEGADERGRPYATPARPHELEGGPSFACERTAGRPCGDGAGASLEVDSTAGLGPWLSISSRVRAGAGTGGRAEGLAVDRAVADVEVGWFHARAGRDVLAPGPAARFRTGWGEHAPPLDHVRVGTARPLDLAGARGRVLRAEALWVAGRLREPQRFHHARVAIGRIRLDLLLELFRRSQGDGVDASNHRLSFDGTFRVPALGARVYAIMTFEDTRREVWDAMRHDADHTLGLELAALARGRHGLVLEVLKTGYRSQAHHVFTSGFTTAGRAVGAPLGPSAVAAYAALRLDLPPVTLWPSIEWARLSADRFEDDGRSIRRAGDGPEERRLRLALRARASAAAARLEARAWAERVQDLGFTGPDRWNAGGEVVLAWGAEPLR